MLIADLCKGCKHDRKDTCPVIKNPGSVCKGKVKVKRKNK